MTDRNRNDPSPWLGLTAAQIAQLNEAQRDVRFHRDDPAEQYRAISDDFARRTAILIVSNDVLGALDTARIATACASLAHGIEQRRPAVADALEADRQRRAADPEGMLVHIPGQRRRKRVFPGDPLHPATGK